MDAAGLPEGCGDGGGRYSGQFLDGEHLYLRWSGWLDRHYRGWLVGWRGTSYGL